MILDKITGKFRYFKNEVYGAENYWVSALS